MADSGTYDDATLLRKQKIAEMLYADALKPRKIEHWTQGLAQMAQAGIQGATLSNYDQQAKENEAALAKTYAGLLGGGASPAAAPAAPPQPQQVPTGGAPMVAPPMGGNVAEAMGGAPDASMPRGIRNNNPGNIEDGSFAQGLPGYAGTDGRFAKFAGMDQGVGAMNRLLDSYEKRGFNTPSAIINRWAPPSDNNPTNAYAANVAKAAGIGPDDPVTPDKRQAIIQAMIQQENGRGLPQSAPPAPPSAAPAQPDTKAQIAGLLSSQNPAERKLGMQLAQNVISQQFKADQPTDEMREYNLDSTQRKARGEQPLSFFDFKSGLKKAGATNVTTNVDNKGEGEFDKAAAKQQADRFNELASEGPQAKQMVSDVQTLTQLGNQIGTGKGAEFKAKLGPYADAVGVKVDGLSDIQAFEAVVNRVAPNLRVKGSGAQSDFELKNFLKSIPSLGNTAEGNALVGKTLEGLAQNKVRAAEIGSKALNKEITRPEAEKMLRELPDPMAEWREATKNQATKTAAPTRDDIEAEMRRRKLIP